MKICCLGDIHYSRAKWTERDLDKLAENIRDLCRSVDAIVIVGDITSDGRLDLAHDVLIAIKSGPVIKVPKLVVPGNHDIYLTREEMEKGIDSLTKLERFNNLVDGSRFSRYIALMKRPYIVNSVGFVGSIGWYDYTFTPAWMNLPISAFREKAYGRFVWLDKYLVKLPFSDEDFTQMLLDLLEKQIKEVYNRVNTMVAALHHVPFRDLVIYRADPSWDYFSTFMGSERFGELLLKYSYKVKLVVYGHQHGEKVETGICRDVRGVKCCNCASPTPIIIEL